MAMLARLAGNLMPYSGVSRAAMLTPDRTHSGVPSGPHRDRADGTTRVSATAEPAVLW